MMDDGAYRSSWEQLLDLIDFYRLAVSLPGEPGLRETALALGAEIARREAAAAPEAGLALAALRRALRMGGAGWFCAGLALCCELDGGLRNTVQELTGAPVPTFDLAGSLYGMLADAPPDEFFALSDPDGSPLCCLLDLERQPGLPRLFMPLTVRENVLRFVTEGRVGGGRCRRPAPPCGPDILALHEDVLDVLSAAAGGGALLYLAGPPGSGRHTLMRRLALRLGVLCLFLDLEACAALDARERRALSYELALDTVLCRGLLCAEHWCPEREACLRDLVRTLPRETPLAAVGTGPPPRLDRGCVARTLGVLSGGDFQRMAQALQAASGKAPDPLPEYRLTPGRLQDAWQEAGALCRAAGRLFPGPADFSLAVRAGAGWDTRTAETLEDLVAAPETMEGLRTVRALAENRRTADAKFRAAGLVPYGRGVTALFYGPSGTGKTMAARALSSELGLALRRIDLSQVLDKYIGETEKHLAEIFRSAGAGNTILFFDEADALFGKRTEISSSHDRYANVETAFLLQSIEEYDGIVLLATNLYGNFDTAFLRRISAAVRFSMPDAALRQKLWERSFPPGCLAPDVCLPSLARDLELSPASIRSAAHTAVALAGESSVTAGILLQALQNELGKSGQSGQAEKLRFLLER